MAETEAASRRSAAEAASGGGAQGRALSIAQRNAWICKPCRSTHCQHSPGLARAAAKNIAFLLRGFLRGSGGASDRAVVSVRATNEPENAPTVASMFIARQQYMYCGPSPARPAPLFTIGLPRAAAGARLYLIQVAGGAVSILASHSFHSRAPCPASPAPCLPQGRKLGSRCGPGSLAKGKVL